MAQHKYKIGEVVGLIPNRLNGNIPGGNYTVQRLLPQEGRDCQYRVKNTRDGHERVVRESQLVERIAIGPREFAAFRPMT